MLTFIYKRTHRGDPDENGCFGIHDCMGEKRSLEYKAVIGIGGRGAKAKLHGIDYKVNWVGIGPHKHPLLGLRPRVTFDHFVLYEKKGQPFKEVSKTLANRLYSPYAPRFLIVESDRYKGIRRLLAKAKKAPKSRARSASRPRSCAKKGPHLAKQC